MIVYICSLATNLAPIIAHRMSVNSDEKADLFISNGVGVYGKTIGKKLQSNDIFNNVYTYTPPSSELAQLSVEEQKKVLVDYYDEQLKKMGKKIEQYDTIFLNNDNFATSFTLYLNIRGIKYVWIEVRPNHYDQGVNPKLEPFKDLYKEYSVFGASSENAMVCVHSLSDVTKEKYREKIVSEWNPNESWQNMSKEDITRLSNAFGLNEKSIELDAIDQSTVFLTNSYGYLDFITTGVTRAVTNKPQLSNRDYYSSVFKTIMDYYIDDNTKTYVKTHVHDYISPDESEFYFGENIRILPNVPFEILNNYLRVNTKKFKRTILINTSTVHSDSKDNITLGVNFVNTWWYYDLISASIELSSKLGNKIVGSSISITKQLQLLSGSEDINEGLNYDQGNGSLIIDCLYDKPQLEDIKGDSAAILINTECLNSDLLCDYEDKIVSIDYKKVNSRNNVVNGGKILVYSNNSSKLEKILSSTDNLSFFKISAVRPPGKIGPAVF